MNVAITEWQGRVAPLFDVAGTVVLVDSTGQQEICRFGSSTDSPQRRIDFLVKRQVFVLICGAISRSLKNQIEARGIQVHAFVSGDIPDVLEAWHRNQLNQPNYAMPGCRRCRCRGHSPHKTNLQKQGGISCHNKMERGRPEPDQ